MKTGQTFVKSEQYSPKNEKEKALVQAFAAIKHEEEAAALLRDLLTTAEIEEFSNRLEIARLLLEEDMSYQEIAKQIGTSTTTVTRVAHWLQRGCGGYWTILQRITKKNK